MKKSILTLGLVLLLFSCSKNDDDNGFTKSSDSSIRNYSSEKGTTLQLTNSTWFTEKEGEFGFVSLIISGSTNADKVTVLTIGDGLRMDESILLDANKKFANDTIGISFTHAASNDAFEPSTQIKAIKGIDTLVVNVKGGLLKY